MNTQNTICARPYLSLLFIFSFAMLGIGEVVSGDDSPNSSESYRTEIQLWRAKHEEKFRSPGGWLALVGHHWLVEGDNPFGNAPNSTIEIPEIPGLDVSGNFQLTKNRVRFQADPGSRALVNEGPVKDGYVELEIDSNAAEADGADRIQIGTRITLQLVRRNSRFAVRVRDSQSPLLVDFKGKAWRAVDPKYRVEARYMKFAEPKLVKIVNIKGDETESKLIGSLEFTLEQRTFRLDALADSPTELFVIFKDKTCGKTSYGAGRFLDVSVPASGDKVTLDFNKAYSPPCAYSPHTLCPLPPKQNQLDIAIEAGEILQASPLLDSPVKPNPSNPAGGAHWTQWRGPNSNGTAASDAHPPVEWDTKKNIKWIAELPGEGSSTPIVWGNQMFVLSAEATNRKTDKPIEVDPADKTAAPDVYFRFLVTCLDRHTGKTLWQQLASEQVPHEGRHQTHTYAAGSPTTDGELLYASFGSRGIFAYTLDGQLKWQVDLGDMQTRFGWGEAVTPALAGDRLIVNWDQEKGSFITALDKKTGKELWRVERPEEVTSWNTPLIVSNGSKTLAVVNGTHRVKAYDIENGSEVWACGGQTVNAIPSPVPFEDTVIVLSGYRASAGFAIPIDSRGDLTETSGYRWKIDQGTPYVPSPAISGNRLFFTQTTSDVMSVIDARTGSPLSERKRLSGVKSLYSSPLVAGGHIYFAGREGTTVVIKDDESLETVAVNSLNEPLDASPIAIGDYLYLRTWSKVFAISN